MGEHPTHKPPVLKKAFTEEVTAKSPTWVPLVRRARPAQPWGRPQVSVEMVRGLQGWASGDRKLCHGTPVLESTALLHIMELPFLSCHPTSQWSTGAVWCCQHGWGCPALWLVVPREESFIEGHSQLQEGVFSTELHCSVERTGPSLKPYSEVPKVSGCYFPSHKIHFWI